MQPNYDPQSTELAPLDEFVVALGDLRKDSGDVSFGEIAARIAKQRIAAGVAPAAARVARSSVHAVFAKGRQRLNTAFVAEIVLALTGEPEVAEAWKLRCIEALRVKELQQTERTPVVAVQTIAEDDPVVASVREGQKPEGQSVSVQPIVYSLILSVCVGLNFFGATLNDKFQWPLFLDMVGTAVAAIALGPWSGVIVGVFTNGLTAIGGNPVTLAFVVVNIVGALLWGYGVRGWKMRRPWWRFLLLNLVVGVVTTAVASLVSLIVFGGIASGHAITEIARRYSEDGMPMWLTVFIVILQPAIFDKLISGYFGLAIATKWSNYQADLLPAQR